jgi:hypothetical protein
MMRSFLVHQGRLDNGLLVRITCHFGGIGTTRAIASIVPVVVPVPVPVVVPDGLLLPIIIPVMGEASNPSADYLRPVRWWCNSIVARVKYSIMVDVLA